MYEHTGKIELDGALRKKLTQSSLRSHLKILVKYSLREPLKTLQKHFSVFLSFCRSHHHQFPPPGEKGKAATGRKLEFTGFALSNTAGGKGRGTQLFWCHILEHSVELWVGEEAQCYNFVTLSHFGRVFGVDRPRWPTACKLSI